MILNLMHSHDAHDYLRDTLNPRYRECNSCLNRTEYTCIRCGFCWSCHWKVEQVDKIDFLDTPLVKETSKSVHSSYSHSAILNQARDSLMAKAVDVFGKRVEPICDYLRCHHKLSVHGLSSGKCRCKHPQNAAIGA